ncbi:hypothetical protein KC354_g43 [Hortaea werneckii]|nr:hypothetical protein KC354_g43 [Hortaea werneckii]
MTPARPPFGSYCQDFWQQDNLAMWASRGVLHFLVVDLKCRHFFLSLTAGNHGKGRAVAGTGARFIKSNKSHYYSSRDKVLRLQVALPCLYRPIITHCSTEQALKLTRCRVWGMLCRRTSATTPVQTVTATTPRDFGTSTDIIRLSSTKTLQTVTTTSTECTATGTVLYNCGCQCSGFIR